ncbi:MAG: RNase H1/viroplasmin domain-containing protein [Eubacteriales bacterium]
MIKYYAFITPIAVGVFTSWLDVERIVTGIKGAQHKSFNNFAAAQLYVGSTLSDMDKLDFGLDKNKLYLNKKFIRKQQYIKEQEAKKQQGSSSKQ